MKGIQKWFIKCCRYVLRTRFLPCFAGPLKGFYWSTSSNYDFLTGTYESPETVNEFVSWLNPRTVFYDLGANAGYYSLIAARYISKGAVFAFEPVPAHRTLMEEHLKRNTGKFHAVIKLFPFAVTSSRQMLHFSNTKAEGASYIKQGKKDLHVQGISLDEFVAEGHPPPDIIKIDVEGAELDVLKGSLEILNKYRPRLLLATHDSHLPGVRQDCIDLLHQLGYKLKHTGSYNKNHEGLDDYIAEHEQTGVTY